MLRSLLKNSRFTFSAVLLLIIVLVGVIGP